VQPVFFTDRDLGRKFPEILRAAGLTVERLDDHFPPDCPDETWLEHIGRKGWIAITHDGRIRYKPNELNAVVRHRVALLVVIGKVPFPALAHSFVATQDHILEFIGQHRKPYIAKIYRKSQTGIQNNPDASGRIELWYPQK